MLSAREVLVLPAGARCRALRWPREARDGPYSSPPTRLARTGQPPGTQDKNRPSSTTPASTRQPRAQADAIDHSRQMSSQRLCACPLRRHLMSVKLRVAGRGFDTRASVPREPGGPGIQVADESATCWASSLHQGKAIPAGERQDRR